MSETAQTPSGVRIVAVGPDGREHNVTEGVQVLYDTVIQSMDWGSGFLSVEDVEPIVVLAKLCGFRDFEAAEKYMEHELTAEKQRRCEHPSWHPVPLTNSVLVPYGSSCRHLVCDACGLSRVDIR